MSNITINSKGEINDIAIVEIQEVNIILNTW